ncbi:terminase small subunit [Lysinibacillus irui]|uniref:Terminase small subunit n=1 Tax=Lysinibacillus irui TaxID=2998077 RepID=A0ABU5NJE2_9BACI|nr:terminase small subunit [Lysinibacillus irui]MEA0553772.1 terminase small subunit [Lysinibacillus irui]MEA0976156.1 terminase small subunit [Lysinibacillus irui]MEA1042310.1 terminase small subunit [Lysinibacillus irui]
MADKPKLNKKQELFCMHYVRTLNQSLSARLAGYSDNHNSGYRVMNMPGVRERIEELIEEKNNSLVKQESLVLEKLLQMAMGIDENDRKIPRQSQLKAIEMLYRYVYSQESQQGPMQNVDAFIEALTGSTKPIWEDNPDDE